MPRVMRIDETDERGVCVICGPGWEILQKGAEMTLKSVGKSGVTSSQKRFICNTCIELITALSEERLITALSEERAAGTPNGSK